MRARMAKVQPEQLQPAIASPEPTEAELRKMIAEAAYYRAEKRGFAPGLEADDWREAEAEVMARMRGAVQSRI